MPIFGKKEEEKKLDVILREISKLSTITVEPLRKIELALRTGFA